MRILLYPVTCEYDPGTRAWSVLSPDFPEICSFLPEDRDDGQSDGAALAQCAVDAVLTAVGLRQDEGQALPTPTEDAWALTRDWTPDARHLLLHVPVTPAGTPVRVNISLDQQLLERVDREAERRNMTRSGFLAEGALQLMRG